MVSPGSRGPVGLRVVTIPASAVSSKTSWPFTPKPNARSCALTVSKGWPTYCSGMMLIFWGTDCVGCGASEDSVGRGVGVADVEVGLALRLGLVVVDSVGAGLGEKKPDCEIRKPTKAN